MKNSKGTNYKLVLIVFIAVIIMAVVGAFLIAKNNVPQPSEMAEAANTAASDSNDPAGASEE